jgi:RND family efflux transporter MFP subunit
MHPQIVADRPGDCPICNMRLVPAEAAEPKPRTERAEGAARGPRVILHYRSPADPGVTSDVPMQDAMGRDYVPVYSDEPGASRGAAAGGGSTPEGYATIAIDPAKRQIIGLRLAAVERAPLRTTIRTVGRVAFDETRVHHVHTRYEGYVEQVFADFTGKAVRRGEPLASVYSPDLLATQEELLLALRAARAADAAGADSAKAWALVEAARRRLALWEVGEADIERLERTLEPSVTLAVYAPISGVITGRVAFHGMRVGPDDALFDVADLSVVWVLADVYEYELPRVSLGQEASMTLAYLPGREWRGRVSYIYPTLDERARTAKVRLEFDNRDGDLKPGMFADVLIEGDARETLSVPDDAVLDSGLRKLVFVSHGEGRLEPREVGTGDRAAGRYEILRGLAEGESVAAGANFLLDSESRLRAAISAAASAATQGQAGSAPVAPDHTGHGGGR